MRANSQVAHPLAVERIVDLAHRIAWRYKKSSDPHHSDTYTFNKDTLIQFAAAIGKRRKSTCLLTEEHAKSIDPDAERIPGTCQVINVLSPDEFKPFSTSDVGMRDPTKER